MADISPQLGDLPRRITLPDGAVIETTDNAAIDHIEAAFGRQRGGRWIAFLESHKTAILAAVLITALLVFGFVRYGIPAAAQAIAMRLPAGLLEQAGVETLEILDRFWLAPTALPADERARVHAIFTRVAAASGAEAPCCRLEFRGGKAFGANALSLPDGTVVITDQMVEMIPSDAALAGVFAHEIAHMEQRHALRRLVESSLLTIGAIYVLGDLADMSELLVALPAAVVQARHSRSFEREADDRAIAIMRKLGLDPADLAALFQIFADHCGGTCDDGWLASHPSNTERIAYLTAAGGSTHSPEARSP